MITILGGLAEFERTLILARTSRGARKGASSGGELRPQAQAHPHQRAEALARRAAGEASGDRRSYAVSHSTISRLVEA